MRPIFTIHAGEFLVADYIERNYAKQHRLRVWVPSKDDGIDLLITNENCKRAVTVQVKFSKSFDCERKYDASGWWTLNKKKIMDSAADYWVFVMPKFCGKRTYSDCFYFIIKPNDLLKHLEEIHGDKTSYKMYLTVCKEKVIETRGLRKEMRDTFFNSPSGARDFSMFKDKWDDLLQKVK